VKLPHISQATIPESKLVDYLLNPAHPDNGGKAAFFLKMDFSVKNGTELVAAFRQSAKETELTEVVESPPAPSTSLTVGSWAGIINGQQCEPFGLLTGKRTFRAQ
jgi:hypothetical protein